MNIFSTFSAQNADSISGDTRDARLNSQCPSPSPLFGSWGVNDEGALGREARGGVLAEMEGQTEGSENVPERVAFPAAAGRVQSICAGDSHSVALTAGGQLFVWGVFRDSSGRSPHQPHRLAPSRRRRPPLTRPLTPPHPTPIPFVTGLVPPPQLRLLRGRAPAEPSRRRRCRRREGATPFYFPLTPPRRPVAPLTPAAAAAAAAAAAD